MISLDQARVHTLEDGFRLWVSAFESRSHLRVPTVLCTMLFSNMPIFSFRVVWGLHSVTIRLRRVSPVSQPLRSPIRRDYTIGSECERSNP
jgi:hypothetical protein